MKARSRTFPIVGIALVLVVALALAAATLLRVGPWRLPEQGVAGAVPHFVDDTLASKLEFTYDGPFEYAVGGGVAVFDCNDDRLPDLYLAGGEASAGLFRNDSQPGAGIRFSHIASGAAELTRANGAYPIEVDGDGQTDLMVLRNGENVLLRGLGDCRFDDANERWGLRGGSGHTEAFSATWEPNVDWPTLAFGNYVNPAIGDPSTWCESNELIRPAPDERRFGDREVLEPSYCATSMLFSGWGGSRRVDLRVSNDVRYYDSHVGQEQLWQLTGVESPRQYTSGEGWGRVQLQGMGIASRDLTGDGFPEVYLTGQGGSQLLTLAGGPNRPAYRDIAAERNVNVAQPFFGGEDRPSTGWHPEFEDVNNDGFVDLFVAKGNVGSDRAAAQMDPSNLLLGQPDASFHEIGDVAGTLNFDRGRGAALADFNVDGWPDLIESFYGAQVRVWRNTGPENAHRSGAHWIGLRVTQPGPNSDAIGALVEVRFGDRVDRQEVTIGGGHAGGEVGWLHVGLGTATTADVHIRWPDGTTTDVARLSANAFYLLERGAAPLLWAPELGAE